jgi:hypothetical protein
MTEQPTPPDPDEEEARRAAETQFSLARANAINAYANLEARLAFVFQQLLGAEIQQSFATFAGLGTTRQRSRLLRRLLNLKHNEEYNVFYDSLSLKLDGLALTRNKIVHWMQMTSRTGGLPFDKRIDVFLADHPDIFSEAKFYKHEIVDFTIRVEFYSNLVYHFFLYLQFNQLPADPGRPWPDIFHEQVAYPPPEEHPLFRYHKARADHHRSSGA